MEIETEDVLEVSETPSHDEIRAMLPAAALEMLDSADLQRVLTHARDCVECNQLLAEFREAAASLAFQLPAKSPDPDRAAALRARLLARVQGDLPHAAAAPVPAPALQRKRRSAVVAYDWAGWFVAAGLAGILLMHHAIHRPLQYGWFVAGVLSVALVGVGMYAQGQRRRVSALLDRLAAFEPERARPDPDPGP